ncbi:MAG: FAD-dependent monooxygenase [Burkholderiales bacterium]|nr:FAD-dependent monooxygenase [Burkholderiales bacterium]ODU62928.1 MAG: hypothetical protein ABT05_06750 [Lautropia sp. SCN 66-9]
MTDSAHASLDTDVIIVGGGPVGLALAGELGWRGCRSILLEQSDGIVHHPKMDGIDLRVMEFCRRWGLIEQMKRFPFPDNYPQDMVYVTSLAGYELGRESFTVPSGGAEIRGASPSPETRIRCPQNFFDPILRRFAESFAGNSLRFHARYVAHQQDEHGVSVEYQEGENGPVRRVRGRWLVGCDGANSVVREHLGIAFTGEGIHNFTTNVLFRCADLFAHHDKRPGYRWLFIGPEGAYGTMSAINGRDEWRAQLFNDERRALTEAEIRARIDRMIGRPVEYEIVSTLNWVRRERVAAAYRKGHAFLAGDACHATSPTGGFGMNTGIKDAVDLAWKLDAVMKGWAGANLLDTYDLERRPCGARAVREASGNWRRMMSPGSNPGLLEASRDGALLRYEVGRRFAATMLREWYKLGIDLGYTYADSPLVYPDDPRDAAQQTATIALAPERGAAEPMSGFLADGSPISSVTLREWQRLQVHLSEGSEVNIEWQELPATEVMVYRPTSRPGARAPHVWLSDGRSTLDWFGRGWVLLKLGAAAPNDTTPWLDAARERSLPLDVICCDEPAVRAAYRRDWVLVRPDGHVAWRGNLAPAIGIAPLLDRVRGA